MFAALVSSVRNVLSPQRPPAGRHVLLGTFAVAALAFILAPILIVIVNSFNSAAYGLFPPESLSLEWYRNLAAQEAFYGAAVRSVVLGVLAASAAVVVGTMAAYGLVRYRVPGSHLINGFILSPVVMPKIVFGVGVYMFFARINIYGTFYSLVMAHTVITMPFVVAIVSSAVAGLDRELEEAAMDLGAAPLTTFFRIVLPQISVPLVISFIFAFIISFDQVETTVFLVRPGNNTLPIEMFTYVQKWQDPTIAALSTFMIGFSAFLMVIIGLSLRQADIGQLLSDDGGDEQ